MTAPLDLDALERAALAATPGVRAHTGVVVFVPGYGGCDYLLEAWKTNDNAKHDLDFAVAAQPSAILDLIRRLRDAEAAKLQAEHDLRVMSVALAESRANDRAAMGWLADCRMAVGDNGKRMLPEFVGYLKELARGNARYEKLRKLNVQQFGELYQRNIRGDGRFDDLVDAISS